MVRFNADPRQGAELLKAAVGGAFTVTVCVIVPWQLFPEVVVSITVKTPAEENT